MNENEKDEFLNKIEPGLCNWVKNEKDQLTLEKHLRYRLLQQKKMNSAIFDFMKEKLSEKDYEEINQKCNEIYSQFDKWYNNSKAV